MSNPIKSIRLKMRRRKALRQRAKMERQISSATDELANYRGKVSRQKKKKLIRSGIAVAAAAVLVIGLFLFSRYHSYSGYRVVTTSEMEDTVSTEYMEMDGKLFKFSGSDAALEDNEGNIIWNVAYEMQNPIADECNGTIAVADQGGTKISIFDKSGEIAKVDTTLNIVRVKVAEQGIVAAILDGGDDTWINFYATDGSLIAENQTRVDDPGYPLDIAVSEDGALIMVAYQFVSGEETTSYVAFYNFASTGQNQIDNIVSGYQYQGVVVPQIEYMDSSTSVAFRDDGFSIFKGRQIPKESANVVVEQEIVSTFYDQDHIGLVFKNDGQDKLYSMQVYNTSGKMEFQKDFNIAYTDIAMSGGQILMHNDSQVCVITTDGVEKYNGNIDEGTISDFFKTGMNRYVLVLDNGLSTIKFK